MTPLPIIDAHQHFWDLERNYLPWLCDDPMIPFRYGDYSAIRRNYLPEDYRRDTTNYRVVGSVFIETEWDAKTPVQETRWAHELAEREGLPSVMVAQARLDQPDIEDVLAAHCAYSRVRGIRHKPRAAPSPNAVETGAPGSMGDPVWRRGFARLAAHDLSFDLQSPWWHFREAADLAAAHPDTTIIINHTGLPADRSEEGLQGWRKAMAQVAHHPNVKVKISGIGVQGATWTEEANRRIVLETIELFGVERCMFASNFPVDSLVATFETIFSGFLKITNELTNTEQRQLFHDTAQRVYRIAPESLCQTSATTYLT
ncbi:amidohydrolase family protein [Halomonas sp. QX-2]|jgi:predicted TIM-barrel fold metal-dependent hydrolase|uniref:Amidohydrolase family protein n=1 Tax=Vreelandella sedimenti TaxID=2729618 RepID=A0A7Z0SMI3_9GAMM|nr:MULTISPECIES: amidohydrolase family protein [Halomonas]NYT73687.1 amidohydrolase family protein [Halomonas sedimenti]|tara:strand:+ start:468 stop:1412 length:945 start_codon:yes stop_codon:yes gene_type:complete